MLRYLIAAVQGLGQLLIPPPKPPRVVRLNIREEYFDPGLALELERNGWESRRRISIMP